LKKKSREKIIEIDEKRLRKKVALIKIDYEEVKGNCSQPQLATPSSPPHSASLPMIF
jgi:hypothetical protein